jgi:asparagine synthase (glutamine-hydrolysing)
MCGIAGALDVTGRAERVHAEVARMTEALAHRGPDGHATRVVSSATPTVALGHTRLAIIDLSEAGSQPMTLTTADGNTLHITFNGEIYNHADIRRQLDLGGWHSKSDTEVILRAYARWGADCLHRLRGMFAFALWDSRREELFLARDRLGIKPLYYTRDGGQLTFASEVRALLASGRVARRLDPNGVLGYLTYQSPPAGATLIEGVRMLPAGCWLRVGADGQMTQQRYWDLFDTPSRAETHGASREQTANLLRESIALHLVSDVPVAVFLSGGIDSTALVALVRAAGHTPQTFSIGFAERAYDETYFAESVAQQFNTDHTTIRMGERRLLEQLPDAFSAMDQPTGDGINSYVVAGAVHGAGIKVALSGLGGDELFAGYPSFERLAASARWLRAWGRAPRSMKNLLARGITAAGRSSIAATKRASLIASDGNLASLYAPLRQVLLPEQRTAMLEPAWGERSRAWTDPYRSVLEPAFRNVHSEAILGCVSYAEARTYMHDVLLRDTDQLGMAHALEVRVPLLDHVLAEYVVSLPDAVKQKGSDGAPKPLLVESLAAPLPHEVTHRRKQGFTLPFAAWMRGELRSFCETRLSPERLGGRGIFRPEQLRSLWDNFLDDRPQTSWSRVWILVVLEEWLERNGLTGSDLAGDGLTRDGH